MTYLPLRRDVLVGPFDSKSLLLQSPLYVNLRPSIFMVNPFVAVQKCNLCNGSAAITESNTMNSAVYCNIANNCKSLFIKFPNRWNRQF